MGINERYEAAKEAYKAIGIDTDAAIKTLEGISISLHCWQGDDVMGFEGAGALTGGIQTTGNYPGRARTPEELMADIDEVLKLVPGHHKLNLHANYAIFAPGEKVDRDRIEPKHFKPWVDFAKSRGLGLDFNPTYFSHEKSANATLSSEDPEIRKFWIDHGKACLRISQYFAEETGIPCCMNIWIPDGFKDTPADRFSPRARYKDSIDQITSIDYDPKKVIVTVESKVFGIGFESYTVGSHEFCMNYAANSNGKVLCLLDNGHYHPTEVVSDKIASMLLFADKVALHVTRGVRWDSDHVVRYDDETREIAKEIVINGPEKVILALDFFDASINRVAAWVTGMRNMQKALLSALLTPHDELIKLQNNREFTELMVKQEEYKTYPVGDVWNYFCEKNGVPAKEDWFDEVKRYEKEVLAKRI